MFHRQVAEWFGAVDQDRSGQIDAKVRVSSLTRTISVDQSPNS
jgi:hypothetical protein